MKKVVLSITFFFITVFCHSQTFRSSFVITQESSFKKEMKERIITITPKEISISDFLDGGIKTLYLIVNKIEEKEYSFDGLCKFYYCTTKDKDPINGYQKAIIVQKQRDLILALFATEIDMYKYSFQITR